jgi:hypothetical protein
LVPAPEKGQTNLFLRSDGTWAAPPASGEGSGYIASTTEQFEVSETGQLSLKEITISQVEGLEEALQANKTEDLKTTILNNSEAIGILEEVIGFKREISSPKVGDIKAGETGYLICIATEDGSLKWEPVSDNLSARIEMLKAKLEKIKDDSEQDISFILEELEKLAD